MFYFGSENGWRIIELFTEYCMLNHHMYTLEDAPLDSVKRREKAYSE